MPLKQMSTLETGAGSDLPREAIAAVQSAEAGSAQGGSAPVASGTERRSGTTWSRGVEGDRRITDGLELALGHTTALLHDRKASNTRGRIDHVIVAESGVWIVDTKNYWGLVERRDVGNWRTTDLRLFVNGRDQTHLVDDLTWQITAIRAALDPIGHGDVPIHPVLLFVGSGGRWFSEPLEIRGVRSMWTEKLVELVGAEGSLDLASRSAIAAQLDASLPTTD